MNWSNWLSCSKTCGDIGQQFRTRTCTNPEQKYDGNDCQGDDLEMRNCDVLTTPCPFVQDILNLNSDKFHLKCPRKNYLQSRNKKWSYCCTVSFIFFKFKYIFITYLRLSINLHHLRWSIIKYNIIKNLCRISCYLYGGTYLFWDIL